MHQCHSYIAHKKSNAYDGLLLNEKFAKELLMRREECSQTVKLVLETGHLSLLLESNDFEVFCGNSIVICDLPLCGCSCNHGVQLGRVLVAALPYDRLTNRGGPGCSE